MRFTNLADRVILDHFREAAAVIAGLALVPHLRGDFVFARRTGTYTSRGRHATSRLFRAAVRRIGGLPAGACLFALMSRAMVERIAANERHRASLLAIIAAAKDASRTSVPVARARRQHGESAYGTLARCAMAARSLWQIAATRWPSGARGDDAMQRRTP